MDHINRLDKTGPFIKPVEPESEKETRFHVEKQTKLINALLDLISNTPEGWNRNHDK